MFVDKNNFSISTGVPVPVDVLKLYLSTNMEDPSDTGMCTGVIY
jgi:hypothetical protein